MQQIDILVVDEDVSVGVSFSKAAETFTEDIRVVYASNLNLGLSHLRDSHFDLVVTEYDFKDGTGLEVVSKAGMETTVVFLCAHNDSQKAVRVLRAGAADYFHKLSESVYCLARRIIFSEIKRKTNIKSLEDVLLDFEKAVDDMKSKVTKPRHGGRNARRV